MLLHRWPRDLLILLLYVGGDDDGIEVLKIELLVIAPETELADGPRVGDARVAIADVGRKELNEAKPTSFSAVKE